MKSTTKLKNCISKLVDIKRSYQLTPQQNRYVDKRTREIMKLQIPKVRKPLPDFLNPPEIYHLLETAQRQSSFDALLIEFLIKTGLRISEANNLMIHQIDFQNNQIKVVEGKGGKDRYVPITNNLLHKLKLFLRERKSGYVFAKSNNTKYSKRALQKRITKIIKLSGIEKKLSTHSLRHTFACLCLARGMRIEDIKLLMGHSNIKTTEIYAKLELSTVKEKYLQLMGQ